MITPKEINAVATKNKLKDDQMKQAELLADNLVS